MKIMKEDLILFFIVLFYFFVHFVPLFGPQATRAQIKCNLFTHLCTRTTEKNPLISVLAGEKSRQNNNISTMTAY